MIEVEKRGHVAIVTMNNPPMNVLCTELLQGLSKALDDIMNDTDTETRTRAIVLTGAGRAFVAGGDIKEMAPLDSEGAMDFSRMGQEVLNKIENLPIPVIAAVNGFALGGGTELAMACDIRLASEAARFGQPEVNLGVIPGFGGTQRLARLVGRGKAKELIFTGNIIDAKTAHSIGLAQQVYDGYKKDENGDLMKNEKGKPIQDNAPVVEAAIKMAELIATKGPVAVQTCKRAINEGMETTLSNGLELETKLFGDIFATKDQKEGMGAFVEKRDPEFTGE